MLHPYALAALKLILGRARFFGCKYLARIRSKRARILARVYSRLKGSVHNWLGLCRYRGLSINSGTILKVPSQGPKQKTLVCISLRRVQGRNRASCPQHCIDSAEILEKIYRNRGMSTYTTWTLYFSRGGVLSILFYMGSMQPACALPTWGQNGPAKLGPLACVPLLVNCIPCVQTQWTLMRKMACSDPN